MHPAYKDDKELCKWLRENSSGNYRTSAYASERIETLALHLDNVQSECEKLETAIRETIEDNLHLADGEICTLIKLKRAINYA